MLHPNFLAHVADKAVALWEKLNIFAARDMARRIADAENHMTASADWQKYKMEQAGQSAEEIRKEIRKTLPLSEKQIKEIFEEATLKSFENDAKVFEAAGMTPPPFNGEEGRKLLQALYEQTNGELYNFTRTTAEQSQRIYIAACDDALMRVRSGLQSKEQAIEQAIEKAAAGGLYVEYPSGHRDTVEVAVRRAVTTGVNQASLRMCIDECDSVGTNFVIVSAHLGARVGDTPHANHAGWQGGIYRIKDREKGFWGMFEHLADALKGHNYPLLSEATGYPDDPLGLGGYNCRHNMMPYFPGVSENHMKQYDEAENKEAYENSQKQRAMERRMRERRRTMEGMKAALKSEEASEELKEEIRKELKKHEEKYKKQKDQYDQFCEDHKLTPQMNRTYVAKPKNTVEGDGKGGKVVPTTVLPYNQRMPNSSGPGTVIDRIGKKGKVETRRFFDSNGRPRKDITTHNHGNPKTHPYGKNGEHAHDYAWSDDGKLLGRSERELTDKEREDNKDIL